MGLAVVMSCDVAQIVWDKYQGYTAAVAKLFLFFAYQFKVQTGNAGGAHAEIITNYNVSARMPQQIHALLPLPGVL